MSVHAARALQQHIEFRTKGGGEGRQDFGDEQQKDLKRRFAALIGATANEIAFIQNTSDGENIVVMGMDLPKRGGNVVIDELHFRDVALYVQVARGERRGASTGQAPRLGDRHQTDMERAVDKNTRLVSMALVSNVNGYPARTPRRSAISPTPTAHACSPTWCRPRAQCQSDVKAMGIDFGSAATYSG